MEERVSLVVRGVGHDDEAGRLFTGDRGEELIPQPPRPPLDPLASHAIRFTDPQVTNHARKAQPGGKVCHEGGIRRGSLAEVVPRMRYKQLGGNPLPCCQAVQTQEERHAVGAAGDTHHHPLRPEAVRWQDRGEGREKSCFGSGCGRFEHGHGVHSGLGIQRNEIRKLGDSAAGTFPALTKLLPFGARKRH